MRETVINDRYTILLPEWLALWDAWSDWERVRFESMEEHLSTGDVLLDIGSEHGAISAIYAKYFTSAICLFEPTGVLWPNIRATFKANHLRPLSCCHSLVSDINNELPVDRSIWPAASEGEQTKARTYTYIHEHGSDVPQITLDTWHEKTGITPHAVTIDVEGAELRVLRGCREMLRDGLKVWVSVHPDLMGRDYGDTRDDLLSFMSELGYQARHLGTDHEEHHYFWPGNSE